MFLVFRPPQTRRQFQVAEHIVIAFAERGIGLQQIGILAQKVIVAVVVEVRNRIRINISAGDGWFARLDC